MEPDRLFAGAESEEPLVDLEGLQFESAAEGAHKTLCSSPAAVTAKQILPHMRSMLLAKWGMGQLFSTAAVVPPWSPCIAVKASS